MKKIINILLAVSLLVIMLAGCGSDDDGAESGAVKIVGTSNEN